MEESRKWTRHHNIDALATIEHLRSRLNPTRWDKCHLKETRAILIYGSFSSILVGGHANSSPQV
jgi:hypothetical protein